jgi:hypothetical protein
MNRPYGNLYLRYYFSEPDCEKDEFTEQEIFMQLMTSSGHIDKCPCGGGMENEYYHCYRYCRVNIPRLPEICYLINNILAERDAICAYS